MLCYAVMCITIHMTNNCTELHRATPDRTGRVPDSGHRLGCAEVFSSRVMAFALNP